MTSPLRYGQARGQRVASFKFKRCLERHVLLELHKHGRGHATASSTTSCLSHCNLDVRYDVEIGHKVSLFISPIITSSCSHTRRIYLLRFRPKIYPRPDKPWAERARGTCRAPCQQSDGRRCCYGNTRKDYRCGYGHGGEGGRQVRARAGMAGRAAGRCASGVCGCCGWAR